VQNTGIAVVLTTGRNMFSFCGITGKVIDGVIDFNTHSTRKYR